jgi:hypothetical protein
MLEMHVAWNAISQTARSTCLEGSPSEAGMARRLICRRSIANRQAVGRVSFGRSAALSAHGAEIQDAGIADKTGPEWNFIREYRSSRHTVSKVARYVIVEVKDLGWV